MVTILQTAKDNAFNATDLCRQATGDLKEKYKKLKRLLGAAENKVSSLADGLDQLKDIADNLLNDPADMLQQAQDSINDTIDQINALSNLGQVDDIFDKLAKCIGPELLKKYFGIDYNTSTGKVTEIKQDDIPKIQGNIIDALHDKIDDELNSLGNAFDSFIGRAFDALENSAPGKLLDELFKIIDCAEQFCEDVETTAVDIENQLSAAGLGLDGSIDFKSAALAGIALSSKQRNYARGLGVIASQTNSSIAQKVSALDIKATTPTRTETVYGSATKKLFPK